jgi:hypothetical protein
MHLQKDVARQLPGDIRDDLSNRLLDGVRLGDIQ